MLSVDWPNRVNYMARRKFACSCDYCFPRRQATGMAGAPDFAAGCDDRWTTSAMDRAINSSASHQGRIRRVDDRVDILLRNVADRNKYAPGEKLLFSWKVQA